MLKKISGHPVAFVLTIAFFVRLILFFVSWSFGEESFYLYDSYRYLNLGENLFEHGYYTEDFSEPLYESIFVPPAGPVTLYLLTSIGGIPLLIFSQIILQLFIFYYFIQTIRIVFPGITNKLIIVTGLFYAIDIPTLVFGNLIMTETLFTFFFIYAIYNFIRFISFNNHLHLFLFSVFLGMAALTRPIAFYFPVFMLLFFLVIYFRDLKLVLKNISLFIIPFYLITGSWMMINKQKHDQFFFSYIGDFNLYYHQAADIYAKANHISIRQAREEIAAQVAQEYRGSDPMGQVEFYQGTGKIARAIILSYPVLFLKNVAHAEVNLFFRPMRDFLKINLGSKELFHTRSKNNSIAMDALVYWQILLNVLTFLLLPFGIIYFFTTNRNFAFFILIFLAYFMITCSIPILDARFRIPMEPILLITALAGTLYVIEKITKRRLR